MKKNTSQPALQPETAVSSVGALSHFIRRWWFQLAFGLVILLASFVRLNGVTKFPPSLYWEEAALGYDAYSILKTGKDHHGHPWPIVAFESFGDYKPSGYFYALLPSIAVFGLTDFAVRFPSALAGVLSVIAVGLLARTIIKTRSPLLVQLAAMVVMALNPWAIQFSRGGWEVNVATCLVTWAMWLGLGAVGQRWWRKAVPAVILLVLSMYVYHATRLIAPLLLITLGLYWLRNRWQDFSDSDADSGQSKARDSFKITKATGGEVQVARPWRAAPIFQTQVYRQVLWPLASLAVIAVLIALPLLLSLGQTSTSQRFAETSILSSSEFVLQSNELQAHFQPTWLGKILFHRYWGMAAAVAKNYFSHLNPEFLFVSGDHNPRHSTQLFGLFYPFEAILLLFGLEKLFRQRSAKWWVLVSWLLIGLFPAALTQPTPHALRILPTIAVWIVMITAGLSEVVRLTHRYGKQLLTAPILKRSSLIKQAQKLLIPATFLGLVGVYLLGFGAFWDYYSKVYPARTAGSWQYGYAQVVAEIQKYDDGQTPIYFTREQGRPAMYYWFYTKTDPSRVQAENAAAPKDQAEFLKFANLQFVNSVNEARPGLVASSLKGYQQLLTESHTLEKLDEVKSLNGEVIWVVYRFQK